MAKFTDKISSLIQSQVPDFVVDDHPKFIQFLKTYYTFLEASELVVTSVETTEGILLETETNQNNELLLDGSRIDSDRTQLDSGDKLLLESSAFGKFTRGETVTGQTSGATSTVLAEDLDNGRLFISAQDKFIIGETILGSSSTASAIVDNYKPNPVQTIQELLNFRDPDKVISNFLSNFRNEILNTIPDTLVSGLNKRSLIKNVKSLYRTKGTNQGHQIFFRLLFGEESQTTYPRENILRVSDGKWNTSKILRAIATTGETGELIGRTITGLSSNATAIIENVFKFQIGDSEVSEFILNEDTLFGTFTIGEEIRSTASDTDDVFIKAIITGIPNTPTVTNDGSLYSIGDNVSITSGGQGALIQVGDVGRGGITEIIIDDAGTSYEIGDAIIFTNTNTGGGSASAKVRIVNGGFSNEDDLGDRIVLEDETTRGDPYTGNVIVQESATGNGDITDIRMVNKGSNYLSLPTVTVDDSNGSGAVVKAYGSGIGRVLSLKLIEAGKGYEESPSPPSLSLPTRVLVIDQSGNFQSGETVTGLNSDSTQITATFSSVDNTTNILTLTNASGIFAEDTIITGSSSSSYATIKKVDQATATTNVISVLDTAGNYINQDGHASEATMKVQDSLLYQDFSYIIKVGRSINDWRDSFKQTMHSAGFYFTGQVNIQSQVNAQLRNITGINSGEIDTPISSVLNTLFSTIFGRRLGTTTDGTSLNATPKLGRDPLFDDSTTDFFTPNTRDVTLNQYITLRNAGGIIKELIDIRGNTTKYGRAVAGPTLFSVNKLILGDAYAHQIQIQDLQNLRLEGTLNSSIDGELNNLSDFNYKVKTSFAIPTEVWQISSDSFDETLDTFDETGITFDAA
jgi:hypothetical protein